MKTNKFKVGDKVKNIWNENVYTVTSVIDTGYILDDRYLPFDDETKWMVADPKQFKPKFNLGDIIVCKDDGLYGIRYVITEIKQDHYVAIPHLYKIEPKEDKIIPFDDENKWEYPLKATELENDVLKPKFKVGDRVRRKVVDPHNPATRYIYTVFEIENGKYCLDHNDHESWFPISYQDSLELVEEPEPKLKLGVDLNKELRIDTLWKNTLANLVGDITKRNTDSFVWLIDETLKFTDCGAYDEMACNGMRLFAKELKKRLGYETDIH